MANIQDEVIKDAKKFEKLLDELDQETLTKIAEDESVAEEYARDSVKKTEPENLNDEYIKDLAKEMQAVARMRLKERKLVSFN